MKYGDDEPDTPSTPDGCLPISWEDNVNQGVNATIIKQVVDTTWDYFNVSNMPVCARIDTHRTAE